MNIDKLINEQKFFRRFVLIWAIIIVTYTTWFVLDKPFLIAVGNAGVTIILAIIGILATVIGFYQWHRSSDDKLKGSQDVSKP